jgi:hypothetical protein
VHAIPTSEGRIIRGKYVASGSASVAGVTVQYLPSSVRMTSHGKLKGFITRVVTSGGVTLQSSRVKVRGSSKAVKVRSRKGNFTADAVIRVEGAVFRGSFNGLTDQRLSRYFRGKINGQKNSHFLLRSQ